MKLVKLGAVLSFAFSLSLQCQAQCTKANVNGTFYYTAAGSVKNGTTTVSYAELAKLIADGDGNFSGQTTTSTAGVLATLTVSGSYNIQANCSGTATLTTSANTAQISLHVVD